MKKISHFLLSIVIVCIGGITGCNQVSSVPETSSVDVSSSTEIVYELLDSEIVNGDVYTYDISTYGDGQKYDTEIIVQQGMTEVSNILIENGEWGENYPRISKIVVEKDVNFDGNMDVLIHLGQFGEKKDLRYKCYLGKSSGLEYCKGFEDICNAEVFSEIPMIVGHQRNGENVTFERYEIVDNEIRVIDSFDMQTEEEYILYDEIYYDLMFHREQPDVVTAYEYIIKTYEKVYPDACSYNLVYFDEDEVQELVVEMDGCFVSLYMYHVGEVYPLMSQWTYGAGGNYGYEYIEKEGIVRNVDSDNGGDIRRITFLELTGERQLVQKYSLVEAYEDKNGNVIEDEVSDGEGKWNYYYSSNDTQNTEITQGEFEEYLRDGECVFLQGKYSADEMWMVIALEWLISPELQLEHEDDDTDKAEKYSYPEYMYDRALINTDNEEEFWQCINENPIDKVYTMGPNVTTEARIMAAAEYRDRWNAEIDHAIDILQTVMNEYQYNMLITSYESWKIYMEQFTSVERDMFYLGGVSGDFETYPHVSEVEATRTKDFAVQLLALEYAYTGEVEYAFEEVLPD